ncbi:glycoside hydrolase family 71/99-like protein [Chitinophaga sp. Cy-1792]|uniref:glycoside hydrolase family 71/99-like protein n=1 Tax=Chitinophaga sp. Cy-1792 TaxID=2608339 RepID=UPI001420A6C4|nr:glycoside hydrolase family 71/99-like protein [Chitinophaga sp. Cy-1792]NIG54952.1 xylosidase [Chitinophaga sp. Cy-1792]
MKRILIFLTICILSFHAKARQRPFHYPSYKGLVMAGYQGWFNTPNDGAGRGWHHYEHRGVFAPGSCEVDLWPDMREYKKQYPSPFRFADSSVANVFSPYDQSTVDLHFKWMKDYGIDGVFMQRFIAEVRNPSGNNHFNTVLHHAMAAAKRNDRAICIMYDLSGMNPGEEQFLLNDLDALTKEYGLLEKSGKTSPTYLHHNGKPLVTIWGVGFNDHRKYGFKEAEAIIDGLKSRGFSVMLGVPTYWREFGSDALHDEALHQLLRKCDIVAPWFVGRYGQESYPAFHETVVKDIAWCKENHVDYVPLAFPGFSWRNMNGPNAHTINRNKGAFFWQQVAGAKAAGAEMLYIAMFDEMNEGTSIFKCATASQLPLNPGGVFVGIEDELGSDHYLWLAGQAANWFHGKSGYNENLPKR